MGATRTSSIANGGGDSVEDASADMAAEAEWPVHEIRFNGGLEDGSYTPHEGDPDIGYAGLDPSRVEGLVPMFDETAEMVTAISVDEGKVWVDGRLSTEEVTNMLKEAGYECGRAFEAGSIVGLSIVASPSGPPIYIRRRPCTREQAEAQNVLIQKLFKAGIIRPAMSAWNFPVMLVRKHSVDEGTGKPEYRMVVDLQRLNERCTTVHADFEPLADICQRAAGPRVVGAQRVYTTMDFAQFYFQASVEEASQKYFCFTDPQGRQWAFVGAPMGWCNTPALTGIYLQMVLQPFEEWLAFYVDDVILWAESQEELRARTQLVVQRLMAFGIQLKEEKLVMGVTKARFGGYDITAGEVRVSEDKVREVREWAEPRTKVELRRFVHFARWLGPFVPQFEERVLVLDKLLAKSHTWVRLNDEERAAFDDIKEYLTSDAKMAVYDEALPLEIHMDSSDHCGGCIVMQEDVANPGGAKRVLAYFSFRLKKAELNYDARSKEALSLVKASRKFEAWFLRALSIVVYTDHRSLKFLQGKTKQSTDRIARWATHLGMFHIEWVYVRGVNNQGPDALSRREPAVGKIRRIRVSTSAADRMRSGVASGRVRIPPWEWDYHAVNDSLSAVGTGRVGHDVDTPPSVGRTAVPTEWLGMLEAEYAKDGTWGPVQQVLRGQLSRDQVSSRTRSLLKVTALSGTQVLVNTARAGDMARTVLPVGTVRDRLLGELHNALAHPGAERFGLFVVQHFFVEGLDAVVRTMTQQCEACLRAKPASVALGVSSTRAMPQRRWGSLTMDVMSGLLSEDGFDAILVVTCDLTGRVLLLPFTVAATGDTLVKLLKLQVCGQYGWPSCIYADKGPIFVSDVFKTFCVANRIQLSWAKTQMHVASAERAIRTVREGLRALTPFGGNGWLSVLYLVAFAINRLPSPTDQKSPFMRDLGYNPSMPLIADGLAVNGVTLERDLGEQDRGQLYRLIDAFHNRRAGTAAVHDRGRVRSRITVGSYVSIPVQLYRTAGMRPSTGKGKKGNDLFSGPVLVVADEQHGNWRVVAPEGSKVEPVFHESKLKFAGAALRAALQVSATLPWKKLYRKDGSRRVECIVDERTFYRTTQFLCHFVGSTSPVGEWVSTLYLARDLRKIHEYRERKAAGVAHWEPKAGFDVGSWGPTSGEQAVGGPDDVVESDSDGELEARV
jgi:hypothetical protein